MQPNPFLSPSLPVFLTGFLCLLILRSLLISLQYVFALTQVLTFSILPPLNHCPSHLLPSRLASSDFPVQMAVKSGYCELLRQVRSTFTRRETELCPVWLGSGVPLASQGPPYEIVRVDEDGKQFPQTGARDRGSRIKARQPVSITSERLLKQSKDVLGWSHKEIKRYSSHFC